jgi:hypothetical protein
MSVFRFSGLTLYVFYLQQFYFFSRTKMYPKTAIVSMANTFLSDFILIPHHLFLVSVIRLKIFFLKFEKKIPNLPSLLFFFNIKPKTHKILLFWPKEILCSLNLPVQVKLHSQISSKNHFLLKHISQPTYKMVLDFEIDMYS